MTSTPSPPPAAVRFDVSEPNTCRVCLRETKDQPTYHRSCLKDLFGVATLPALDLDLNSINDMAQRMVGRMSISGVQQKVLVSFDPDQSRIEFAPKGGRYILKPPINTLPEIPANEHVTMKMAALAGIEIPPCGLLELKDGNLAYIVARFDRLADGGKLPQEDFCQLAQLPASKKYDQSAELCVRLLRRYASEPPISILALYRQLLFSWCTGNGDLHLKNLSLLTTSDGLRRLSPAYDLVNTKLVIADDQLALTLGGKKKNLRRADWIEFGRYCQLPGPAIERVMSTLLGAAADMIGLLDRSLLSPARKKTYEKIFRDNLAAIAG